MYSLRSCVILCLIAAATLFGTVTTAWAGGMFHGVRCGEGPNIATAMKILNERMDKGSYARSVHSSLTQISHEDRVLACVLVNREDHVRIPEGYKTQAKCLTRSWDALARSRFGYYFKDRRGWLTDLTLSISNSGEVTACALGQATRGQLTLKK